MLNKERSCTSARFINNAQTWCTTALFNVFSFHCPFQTSLPLFLNVALNKCLFEAACIITTGISKDFAV